MSRQLDKTYNPKEIEPKLYDKWCENKYFHAEVDRSRKPFTIVMPPPNITGKLHMGLRKPGCRPITVPKHEPIKRVYVEMVRQVIESEENHENIE